jgi:hypothetical protein
MNSILNLLVRVNAILPQSLRLVRVLQLIVGIVFLISGLGSTAFWTFKYLDKERFVPFGLSTFRALNWPLSDFVLIFCCLYAAVTVGLNTPAAKRGCVVGGLGFIAQGLLGFYIDSSNARREQFGIELDELQPMILNVWFVGWGAFSIWVGIAGLALLSRIEVQTI